MKKKVLYSEIAYFIGIMLLAFGTAQMERADFGLSTVVAPAYLLHLAVSRVLPFFTFGMAEYVLQAAMLLVMMIIFRRFRPTYFFSFVTALIYGWILDAFMRLVALIPEWQSCLFGQRLILFVIGELFCAAGVSCLFHTYFAPEAYELCVKEVSSTYHKDINKVKIVYDCTSCVVAIIMSFAIFGLGHFEGINVGSVVCACVNGLLIGLFSRFFENHFEFKDKLTWRSYFEKF